MIEQYGCRWSVEEKIRFEKQQFNYENIRLQSLTGIKNFMAIINILSAFVSKMATSKIVCQIVNVAKSIKPEVRLVYYRLAEGIKTVFRLRNKRIFHYKDYRYYFTNLNQLEFPGF